MPENKNEFKEKLNNTSINVTDGEHGSVKNDIHGEYYLLSNKNIISKILISNNDRKISEKYLIRLINEQS